MADTKPVETAPAAEPVVETKPTEETPVTTEAAAVVPATETETETPAAAETAETPAVAEEAKEEEAKPVEEGALSHKGEGANFPKYVYLKPDFRPSVKANRNRNLIHSKKFFWFGSDALDLKAATNFKADKVADVAHHVTAWAAETGKGLLFFGEKDKSAPQGAIHLVSGLPAGSEPQILMKIKRLKLPNPRRRVPTSSPSLPTVTSTPSRPQPPLSVTLGLLSWMPRSRRPRLLPLR